MKKINKIHMALFSFFLFILFLIAISISQSRDFKRDPKVLMDRYYLLEKKNPQSAKRALRVLLLQEPNYIPALQILSTVIPPKNN